MKNINRYFLPVLPALHGPNTPSRSCLSFSCGKVNLCLAVVRHPAPQRVISESVFFVIPAKAGIQISKPEGLEPE